MAFTDTLHRLGRLIGLYADEEVEYVEEYDEQPQEAYDSYDAYDAYEPEPERPVRHTAAAKPVGGGYGTGQSYVRAGSAPRASTPRYQPQPEPEEEPQPLYGVQGGRRSNEKIVPLPNQRDESVRSRHSEIIICVRRIEDSEDIINHVLSGQSVILNFEEIDETQFYRVVDMLSGAAFALRGSIRRISRKIYLIAPATVEVVNGDLPAARGTNRPEAYASGIR